MLWRLDVTRSQTALGLDHVMKSFAETLIRMGSMQLSSKEAKHPPHEWPAAARTCVGIYHGNRTEGNAGKPG